jgi:hypothetical protein
VRADIAGTDGMREGDPVTAANIIASFVQCGYLDVLFP